MVNEIDFVVKCELEIIHVLNWNMDFCFKRKKMLNSTPSGVH
jgi:hypothetical protein